MQNYRTLFPALAAEQMGERDFYTIILNLLQYETDVHFSRQDAVSFARMLGLTPLGKEAYSKEDMEEKLREAFRCLNRHNQNCLEYLARSGALDSYNEGRPVPQALEFEGRLYPIFDFEKSLFEKVYVEAPLDSDEDGKRDLLAVYIRRPAETLRGMRVPALYIANPYMMGGDDDNYITHKVDLDLPCLEPRTVSEEEIRFRPKSRTLPAERESKGLADVSLHDPKNVTLEAIDSWYEYFVSRGYAAVFAGGIGTMDSEGIRTCGSEEETISTVAVIEWLTGNRKAFTNKTDGIEIKADWCTGNVAMSGKSYLGTLCLAAAATGVKGLKTIIPEAFISSWYDYYRSCGVTAPALDWQGDDADVLADYCFSRRFDKTDSDEAKDFFDDYRKKMAEDEDRHTGNYNQFWDERNYLNQMENMTASVFAIQGLNDWNVKPLHIHKLWKQLNAQNIPCKMMLHQGDHMYINNLAGIDFNGVMNLWLAHWLYDIDNHVMEEIPNVLVQNNLDCSQWDEDNCWPFRETKNIHYGISGDGKLLSVPVPKKGEAPVIRTFHDDLDATGFHRKGENFALWRDAMCLQPLAEASYRLAYSSPLLERQLRINGQPVVTFRAAIDAKAAILSAMLVDFGSNCRYTVEPRIIRENGVVWGRNTSSKDLIYFTKEKTPSPYRIITRGWMSAKNRTNNYSVDEVIPGEFYTFTLPLIPMDYTLEIGHQLVLILYGTDAEVTQRPIETRYISVEQNSIRLELPVFSPKQVL